MKEGLKLTLKINYWLYFNRLRYSLFAKLVDDGMVNLFAFRKVEKLSKKECVELLEKLHSTSKAWKQGYADGDYWNGSQNPYHFKNDYKNWLEYESGFKKCKKDKIKYWTEALIEKAKEPKVKEEYDESEPIDIEKYKKLLEQHVWKYTCSGDKDVYENGVETHNRLLKIASISPEFRRAYFSMKEKMLPPCGH